MGEMSDWFDEQGLASWAEHIHGLCDTRDSCSYCREEEKQLKRERKRREEESG